MTTKGTVIRLLVASETGDQFLVYARDAGIDCPRLLLRHGPSDKSSFGKLVEITTRQQLGLIVSYIGLLAFQPTRSSCEFVVLVALQASLPADQPRAHFRMMFPHELLSAGLPSDLVAHFAAARERSLAERNTTGQHVEEQYVAELGGAIQHARDRALAFLGQHVTVENGCRGWSPFFDSQTIGVLSTAQGLLGYIHAGQRGRIVDDAASTLERMQNPDGGWQVRRTLVGHESAVSITESTCYCVWALLDAGRVLESPTVRHGVDWLERAQQSDGGWQPTSEEGESQVSTTATAIRILARCDRPGTVARGVAWLRAAQRRDGGWGPAMSSGFSSPAYTAHAVLALLVAGMSPAESSVRRGCDYLRKTFQPQQDEPWKPISSITVVDDRTASRLEFKHFATPWVLAALSLADRDRTDPVVTMGTRCLLQLQEATGAWRCELVAAGTFALWAVHDALFALSTIVQVSTANLAPLVRNKYRERERQLLHEALGHLLNERLPVRTRRHLETAWLSVLTVAVTLIVAAQLGLFHGLRSDSGLRRALAAGVTALITVIGAVAPPILTEEYRIRRGGQESRQPRPDMSL